MRRIACIIASVLLLTSAGVAQSGNSATDNNQGIGLSFGYPGNVAFSYRNSNFPVLNVSFRLGSAKAIVATLDYWLLRETVVQKLDWYLGIGGVGGILTGSGIADNLILGARLPIGLIVTPHPNWEIYGEAAPTIMLVPGDPDFDVNGAIGFRYLF